MIYDRKKQILIYPQNEADPGMKGIYLEGARLTPMADFNDELVCVVSTEDIFENSDAISGDLKAISTQINENSNPVLAIMEVK